MINRRIIILITIVFLFVSFLSAAFGSNSKKTKLSQQQAIEIARKVAKSKGYDIQNYNMTGCHYEFTNKDKSWTVLFEYKPPTPPGGHFIVIVDDQTGKATLLPGE